MSNATIEVGAAVSLLAAILGMVALVVAIGFASLFVW